MGAFEITLGRCAFCDGPAARFRPLAGRPECSVRICRACVWRMLSPVPDRDTRPMSGAREAYATGGSRDAFRPVRQGGTPSSGRQLSRAIAQLESTGRPVR